MDFPDVAISITIGIPTEYFVRTSGEPATAKSYGGKRIRTADLTGMSRLLYRTELSRQIINSRYEPLALPDSSYAATRIFLSNNFFYLF